VNDPGTVVADSSHLWRFVTQYGHQGDEYRPYAFHRSENQVTELQQGDSPVSLCDWFLCNGFLRKWSGLPLGCGLVHRMDVAGVLQSLAGKVRTGWIGSC